MEEAYFVVVFDLKDARGHNNPINYSGAFPTERDALEYLEQHPPISQDGRDVGVIVVRGRLVKSQASKSPVPSENGKWFAPKWGKW